MLRDWIQEVRKHKPTHEDAASETPSETPIPIVLVGNKVDLCEENDEGSMRQVATEIAQLFAKDYYMEYFETSARLNIQVEEFIVHILEETHKVESKKRDLES